ncbi:ATP-binding protein [Rufibacter sediminis]
MQIPSRTLPTTPADAPVAGGLALMGEFLIVTAYVLVAGFLFYLAFRREDRERKWVMALFGMIALMGGAVHGLNFWNYGAGGETFHILRLVFGAVALVGAFLLFRAITGLMAIPGLRQLQKANEELQEQLKERENAQLELREAHQALEDRVQRSSAQAITANRELERQIENRKRAEKQLISKNYELIKKNADLDDFVYYASRDLKGPVLNVAGLVEAIREELPPGNPEFAQLFDRLDDSVSSIHRKLNNLAEVSRIQKPVEDAQMSMVSFDHVLQQVKENLATVIQAAQAHLQADFSAAPAVYFSRDNLYSLLLNLISNSIKYREPQRPLLISLSTSLQDQYLVLKVQDNGIGIDLEQYGQHLFSLFRRFHDHVEGSGVGLYIIKRVMDNNRGKVEVESVPGEGTTFLLYFVNHDQETGPRI